MVPPQHDAVCFHCQQSAEKYLKALLEELGLKVPRVHNLDDVLNLLLRHHPALRSLRRGLIFLTDFAVETRYPGDNAAKRQAMAAPPPIS
jgi:HEPN domain-containing protein